MYSAYHLTIQSEIALPELIELDNSANHAVDVIVKFAKIPSHGLTDGKQLGPFLWVSPSSLWLDVPDVARFLIENGRDISIDPVPGIDEESLRVFLLGSAFGALLFQRGLLVLHGNAVQIGNQVMICVGHSGAGKSTLAAGFMRRGYPVLADDVVPIDAECHALPGFPRIKLWQDVADELKIDTSQLDRIRPGINKFNYPLDKTFHDKKLPVRWIYILHAENQLKDFELTPIEGMERFIPLRDNTYRVRYLEGMNLKADHLKLCGKLASSIRLAKMTRPNGHFDLDGLIDHILKDIKANP